VKYVLGGNTMKVFVTGVTGYIGGSLAMGMRFSVSFAQKRKLL